MLAGDGSRGSPDHELPGRFEYDTSARMTGWVDRNAVRYEYVYDDQDRCESQGSTNGDLAYRYDYSGHDEATGHRVTVVTDSLAHERRFVVDGHARVVVEMDPLGASTAYEYDRWGNQTSVTDPLGQLTRCVFDEVGNLTRVV